MHLFKKKTPRLATDAGGAQVPVAIQNDQNGSATIGKDQNTAESITLAESEGKKRGENASHSTQDILGDPAPSPDPSPDQDTEDGHLAGTRLIAVFLALMLTLLIFSLDGSIVSTAIPVIVTQFHAFDQYAWITTAFFLTQCGSVLLAGQLLTAFRPKHVLMVAVVIFEIGSLVCAVANNIEVLIVGRALQGLGGSGVFTSIMTIIAVVTRVDQRAGFMAGFGFVFVMSSVFGPLLGGVFTKHISWRWCFYINLPVGGIAVVAIFFLLPSRPPQRKDGDEHLPHGWRIVYHMDWLGAVLVLAFIACLLLALQWGGNTYAWTNWRIGFLFGFSGLLIAIFFLWELHLDECALIPLQLLKNRTILSAAVAAAMIMMGVLGPAFQLPIYYQAARGHDSQQSGIDTIPFMIACCVGTISSGAVVTKTGRYWPFIVGGPPIAAVGFGLLYTVAESTPNARIIGFQILTGFGLGLAMQNIPLAAQAEFAQKPALVPQASAVVGWFQLTGAAIGMGIISTVQSVYLNRLIPLYVPDAQFEVVRQSPAAIGTLPPTQRHGAVRAYTEAMSWSYVPVIVATGLGLIAAIFIRNHDLRKLDPSARAMHAA